LIQGLFQRFDFNDELLESDEFEEGK